MSRSASFRVVPTADVTARWRSLTAVSKPMMSLSGFLNGTILFSACWRIGLRRFTTRSPRAGQVIFSSSHLSSPSREAGKYHSDVLAEQAGGSSKMPEDGSGILVPSRFGHWIKRSSFLFLVRTQVLSPRYKALDLTLSTTMCWHQARFFSSSSVSVAKAQDSRWSPLPTGAWKWQILWRDCEQSPASASDSSMKPSMNRSWFSETAMKAGRPTTWTPTLLLGSPSGRLKIL